MLDQINTRTNSEILELILKSFQKKLCGLKLEFGYIKQCLEKNDGISLSEFGDIVKIWRITPDVIEEVPNDFQIPKPDHPGRRYECAYFTFTLPNASGLGRGASVWGSMAGGGFSYRVSAEGVEQVETLLWSF